MNNYIPEVNELVSPTLGKSMINLPEREGGAKTGSQIGQTLLGLSGQPRDDYFIKEILSGNIPDSVRNFTPVTVLAQGNLLKYYVSPDVLSVGSNDDYLRISLNGRSAKRLLDQINCTMPTKKMCDDIWRLADLKLNPRPMGASLNMMGTQILVNHNAEINKQIAGRPFTLLTGTKKDTVIDKALLTHKNNVGIYGWFNPNTGVAIQGPQPNCTSHSIDYQDYSSSIRICLRNATLNDKPVDLFDILLDDSLCYLVSEQGGYDARSIYS
jgi:hypothetical protein